MLPGEIITNITGIQQGIICNKATAKAALQNQPKVLLPSVSSQLTWEGEEAAVDRAGDGLELHHVHGLADVHGAGHAAQRAPHELRHLLHREHLQQLVKDGRERVQQGSLRVQEGAQHLQGPACSSGQRGGNNRTLNGGSAQSYDRLGYGWCSWGVVPGAQREQFACSIEKSSAAAIINPRIYLNFILG